MARTVVARMGNVTKGDYEGYQIYWKPDLWHIDPLTGKETEKILLLNKYQITQGGFLAGYSGITSSGEQIPLTKANISKYQEIGTGTTSTSADPQKVADAAFWAGTTGAVIAAAMGAGTQSTHTIAVWFIDGKRSLISLNEKGYQTFIADQLDFF